jgi:hypothetical protein
MIMNDPTMRSRSQHDFEPDEPEPEPQLREVPLEMPEADAIEQRQAWIDDDEGDDEPMMPEEASEADALEQARVALVEEESRDL